MNVDILSFNTVRNCNTESIDSHLISSIFKWRCLQSSLLRGKFPGSSSLLSPSPPEFQAVTPYIGHNELSSEIFLLNDVSVMFTLSLSTMYTVYWVMWGSTCMTLEFVLIAEYGGFHSMAKELFDSLMWMSSGGGRQPVKDQATDSSYVAWPTGPNILLCSAKWKRKVWVNSPSTVSEVLCRICPLRRTQWT